MLPGEEKPLTLSLSPTWGRGLQATVGVDPKTQASPPLPLPLPAPPDWVWRRLRVERVRRVPAAGRGLSARDVAGPTFVRVLSRVQGGTCSGSTGLVLGTQPASDGVPLQCSGLLPCLNRQPQVKDTPPALHLGSLVLFPHPSLPLLLCPWGSNRSSRGQNTISFNKLNLLRLLITSGVGSDQRGGYSPGGPCGGGREGEIPLRETNRWLAQGTPPTVIGTLGRLAFY